MKKILDSLGFKSVSALRKAVKNGDTHALEFLQLMETFLKGGIKSQDITVRGKVDFINYLNLQMGYLKHEEFKAIFLNSSNQIVLDETLFCGTIDRSAVYPRVIIEKAILSQAKGVIFVHNHPSSNLIPSKKDIDLTLEMQDLLDKVDVKLLDHYIVSETENFSFYENGLIEYI
ncbi:JAB domain-containing protein [Cetobacterium sp.]|uniref:JAB domain-containing protein n=1 Tax=Cetobacterium sp. TaxID=2071632 RepID=UPI003EE47AE8